MTNTELAALATTVAATFETTITRAWDGASFTYAPAVELRGGRVIVSVPVNAVLDKPMALAMVNTFRRALVEAVGTDAHLTTKMTKAKGGGRTSIHTNGYWHMGHYNVDGFWCSLSVEA